MSTFNSRAVLNWFASTITAATTATATSAVLGDLKPTRVGMRKALPDLSADSRQWHTVLPVVIVDMTKESAKPAGIGANSPMDVELDIALYVIAPVFTEAGSSNPTTDLDCMDLAEAVYEAVKSAGVDGFSVAGLRAVVIPEAEVSKDNPINNQLLRDKVPAEAVRIDIPIDGVQLP